MSKNEEKKDLTGLEIAAGHAAESKVCTTKDAEYDLTAALLKAASFRTSEEAVTEIEIKRNGEYCFTIHVRPISDTESRQARRKATTFMANPNGRKLPPIEKDFNNALFNSHIIYMATTEEDKKKIWGNQALMDAHDLLDPVESIDVLLAVGEKIEVVDVIMDISGLGGSVDGNTPEDYAKN